MKKAESQNFDFRKIKPWNKNLSHTPKLLASKNQTQGFQTLFLFETKSRQQELKVVFADIGGAYPT